MKLRNLFFVLGLAGLVSACDQVPMTSQESATAPAASPVRDDSAVVAEVNGSPITRAVLDIYAQQRQARQPGADADDAAVLEEIISLELARQQGEKQNLDDNPEVALQIEQQRRAVLASAAMQQHLKDKPITDEELKKIYDENVGSGDEYKARHILLKEKEEAEQVIAELDKGADFSELAKEKSTGPSGPGGGELGWFSAKQMVAPFSDAVAAMEKGSYTKAPVQTQFGWHVIMLDDVRQTTPPDFEMLKPQIRAMVQNQRVQEYLAELREAANINIIADFGGSEAPAESAESAAEAPAENMEQAEETPAESAGQAE
ncbi:MAG: peptidylprolyl isomerase [Thiogranum sp.]|nr:peptidylprolyl isomerase [Thiogranum sp.]